MTSFERKLKVGHPLLSDEDGRGCFFVRARRAALRGEEVSLSRLVAVLCPML